MPSNRWRRARPIVRIVIMGASPGDTSLIGAALAGRRKARFLDGEQVRRTAQKAAQHSGVEEEADAWLDAIGLTLARATSSIVVVSDPLSRTGRDRLRQFAPGTVFVEVVASGSAESVRASRWIATEPLTQDETGCRVAEDAELQSMLDRIEAVLGG